MSIASFRKLVSLSLCVALAACAHLPPPATAGCQLPSYRLVVNQDGLGAGEHAFRPNDAEDFRKMINSELASAHSMRRTHDDLLILSGGSQHGAFGAGFFEGMGETPAGVPNFNFVTGVSTGALVSTLVFLANEPIRDKRQYPAYMTGTGVSNLKDNAAIFSVDKETEIVRVRPDFFGIPLEGVKKGGLATFDPLRSMIYGMLSPATLDDLRIAFQRHRHLLVGVTDLEDGSGYAIDLTQYVNDALNRGVPLPTVRMCYIDALIASSSVPPGIAPTSLVLYSAAHPERVEKPSLYVDGGARFGVFWGQLAFKDLPNLGHAELLINGAFSTGPWDDFETGKHKGKWSILTVARRSSDILVNQVYRFSVDQIEHEFAGPNMSLKEAYLSNKGLEQSALPTAPDQFVASEKDGTRTCGQWRLYDDETFHPLEFHPHYMQCLVQYGRMRGLTAPWNRFSP